MGAPRPMADFDRRIVLQTRPLATSEIDPVTGVETNIQTFDPDRFVPLWARLESSGGSLDVNLAQSDHEFSFASLDQLTRTYVLRWLPPADWPNLRSGTGQLVGFTAGASYVFDDLGRAWRVVGIAESDQRDRLTILTCQRRDYSPNTADDGTDLDPATEFPEGW